MDSSEDNQQQPSETYVSEQPGDAVTEKLKTEPVSEQLESQEIVGDSTSEIPEGEKPENESTPKQPESQDAAGDAPIQKPESEGEPQVATQEVVEELALEKPKDEPSELSESQKVVADSTVDKYEEAPTKQIETQEAFIEPVEAEVRIDQIRQQTELEFASDLVDTIVTQAVDRATELDFISIIVKKIVAHAVGQESSEELDSREQSIGINEIVQDAEDVTNVLKYLLGPESLRFEEVPWRPDIPDSCICFLNIVEYARRFVDDILEKAKEVCFFKYGVPVKYRKKAVEVQNIRWPSIENFTIDLGTKKIDEYIQMTFEVEENWLYKINFIAAQSDLSSDVYLYEVIFCIPTPCYPIAQATVSIYFNCDVSRVKPRECPIDVTYSIESLKEILVPGKTVVNDDMLLRLVYSKLSVFKSLYF